ncbi:extracellular solute-binding protein [Pseudomonas knackmussii B13]|uniref:Extracellular solute-binding protein n=1 Tax=Pseudomonas knackmussii (strain DSM 6978 / CCUG 54928 / LMG 23759 / B13) TaxID=1301098 RepID=A0A024HHP8_PSEKB|nr:transporter substrate-binding domain-containing protein [Pseudomonas knackmussii]CDF84421.1 extracellular solute-binding protein [Pseudomonas knackmussii B13]
MLRRSFARFPLIARAGYFSRLGAGLLLLALAGVGVAAERAPLRVMTDYWPPFRIAGEGERITGLDMDLLAELERRTGLHFDVHRAPWARGLAALQSGQADLMTGLARTPDRERYIDYLAQPYYACAPRLYATKEVAGQINRYEDLRGHTIGYVLESAYFEPFDSDKKLKKFGVSNETQLLQMLTLGRLQLVIGTDCQVDYELRDPQLAQRIAKTRYQPDSRTDLYIGFSRQRPLGSERQLIEAALRQMLSEGWMQRAASRYQPGP